MTSTDSVRVPPRPSFEIIGIVAGRVVIASPGNESLKLTAGQFCLIPAGIQTELWLEAGSRIPADSIRRPIPGKIGQARFYFSWLLCCLFR